MSRFSSGGIDKCDIGGGASLGMEKNQPPKIDSNIRQYSRYASRIAPLTHEDIPTLFSHSYLCPLAPNTALVGVREAEGRQSPFYPPIAYDAYGDF
ncbi:hypothetical protein F7734_30585 [Scytonema sp. UIC 10036]|uniref:hypothetical protein n=1 Tax=Scytonema sp. UIC 10036 TaxID=2304196 RepID=UPI0012DA982C|nr:hypothetical protein [Scytonema sp. UIC 10036]MUG96457.1 hypothetical protein [Scytonema sp. UIC 10036]